MAIANDLNNKLSLINKENAYCVGENTIDLNVKNNSHTMIVENIKKGSVVLDVGCAAGILGKYLGKEHECTIDGIDFDNKALEVAKNGGGYDNLYNKNIENEEDFKYLKSKKRIYDYIIFADVLEHTINPINLIYKFGEFLRMDGEILVSLPNFAHYDVLLNLLNGTFNYSENGILDNTHLRFFTNDSFIDYIKNSKRKENFVFEIKNIGKNYLSNTELDDKYPELIKYLSDNKDYNAFQNLFVLTKVNKTKKVIEKKERKKDYVLKLNEVIKNYERILTDLEAEKSENILLKENIDVLNDKLKQSEKSFEKLQKLNEKIEEDITKIYNSKSWKITKPLRKFIDIFRKTK